MNLYMDKLPRCVFLYLVEYLNIQNKGILKRVCRQFNDWILFKSSEINKQFQQLENIIEQYEDTKCCNCYTDICDFQKIICKDCYWMCKNCDEMCCPKCGVLCDICIEYFCSCTTMHPISHNYHNDIDYTYRCPKCYNKLLRTYYVFEIYKK